MSIRCHPLLVLTGLVLLFFADLVVHPDQTLYAEHSDMLAYLLPVKHFLVHSWRATGELPLWCPYSFGGSPFIHDIQVGAFYPLHLPLYLLPEEWLGASLSWLIVLHVLLAGCGMYVYAGSQGLNRTGALVAAIGYMFAGKWLLCLLAAGYYNLVGMAWLPWMLLVLEGALRRRGPLYLTAAALLFACFILGNHPQWVFYSSLFIVLWTFGVVLEEAGYLGDARLSTALLRWLGVGLWTGMMAAGLSAVQLGPTLEASRWSSRALGVDAVQSIESGLRAVLFFVGPAVVAEPFHNLWDGGGFTLIWITLAALAPCLGGPRVRYQAAVCGALLFFAVGGAIIVQPLPGFRLFRDPSRMLLVAAFPVALLAGTSVQALCGQPAPEPHIYDKGRRFLVRGLVGVGILVVGMALRGYLEGKPLHLHFYWLSLVLTVPVAWWLLRPGRELSPARAQACWTILLLVDLWSLVWPQVAVRRQADVFAPSESVRYLAEQADRPGRVLERGTERDVLASPLGRGEPLALLLEIEGLRGFNPADYLRYRQYLSWMSGADDPLQPLKSDFTFPILNNFPIRHRKLLDLLNTRYLLQMKDIPVDASWRVVLDDSQAETYDFVAGGMQRLPTFTLYENRNVLPRAFVVGAAVPLHDFVSQLETADFRRVALLEDMDPSQAAESPTSGRWTADIVDYQPNRVVVAVDGDAPGYLVLGDCWYPGWQATLDGDAVTLYRANYLFRAVAVPPGRHEVVFSFLPSSYAWGKLISIATLVLLVGQGFVGFWFRKTETV